MIYGMYLSAAGMVTSSYRQDVIANNIANAETVGFKKDLAILQQRQAEGETRGPVDDSGQAMLKEIGGGTFASPMVVDTSQGELEQTGNNMDVAVQGTGYLAVSVNGQTRLTRNGQLQVDSTGQVVLTNNQNAQLLDASQNPIKLKSIYPVTIGNDGAIMQDGKQVAKLGMFNVPDPGTLTKEGGTLLAYPSGTVLTAATPTVRSQFIERSNVEPATELTKLMEVQRQMEANANMIHYQDMTLDKLINDVGKIS